jgi:hypothetical protein
VTWREKVVVRILLLVARMLAADAELARDIHHLALHIEQNAPKAG